VHPTSPWNYALAIDPNDAECAFSVQEEPVGAVPFSPNTPPVVLRVDARRLTEWTLSKNSAGPLPDSPADSAEPVESVELIPYGSGSLRISEFPVTR
jgi:hypothetical protein